MIEILKPGAAPEITNARRVRFFDDEPLTVEESAERKRENARAHREKLKRAGITRKRKAKPQETRMENQHRQIKGYRELSAEEIALMNEVKELGVKFGELHSKITIYLAGQKMRTEPASAEGERIAAAEPLRWAALGKTHVQEGLMALTRAIAQATFF